jgi:hypothetical protein
MLRAWPGFQSTSATPPSGESWDRNNATYYFAAGTFAETAEERKDAVLPAATESILGRGGH